MSDLVNPSEIEQLVGATRHAYLHIGRADSATETFYILHSHQCLATGIDLRECAHSVALDRGLDTRLWQGLEDQPMVISLSVKGLFPGGPPWY